MTLDVGSKSSKYDPPKTRSSNEMILLPKGTVFVVHEWVPPDPGEIFDGFRTKKKANLKSARAAYFDNHVYVSAGNGWAIRVSHDERLRKSMDSLTWQGQITVLGSYPELLEMK